MLDFGLAVSTPLVMYSSRIVARTIERFPILVQIVAGLLGYIACGMMVMDVAAYDGVTAHVPEAGYVAGALGVATVLITGRRAAASR